MSKPRILFFGTPNIAANVLQALLEIDVEVVGVVSQPDKPVGRNKIYQPTPVKNKALENNIPIFQSDKVIDIFNNLVLLKPDVIVTCAFGQFLPSKILNLTPNKCFNLHASLLPKFRGAAPIQYAIMKGEKTTGISVMQMIKEMDAGEYYKQSVINIDNNDTYDSLLLKMTNLAKQIIKNDLIDIINGKYAPQEQTKDFVSFAPAISKEDEHLSFNDCSKNIDCKVRALYSSPQCYAIINNVRYKIAKVDLTFNDNYKNSIPGEIVDINKDGILVKTSDGVILIKTIQREGKRPIDASLYFKNNLNDIKIGMIFE